MESTNFNNMAPHDELTFGSTQYVLAIPGASYIAHVGNTSGIIGLKGMTAGSYNFIWFDIGSGVMIVQNDVSVFAGNQAWPLPSVIGSELALNVRQSESDL